MVIIKHFSHAVLEAQTKDCNGPAHFAHFAQNVVYSPKEKAGCAFNAGAGAAARPRTWS